MTKHNTARTMTVTKTMPVVRSKGTPGTPSHRVRFFDPETARMSGWVAPEPAKPAPSKPEPKPVDYSKMRKAELQALADTRGIKYTTKTTNKALADLLSA